MSEPCFALFDALGGFCRLEKRSSTLDGSVPLRVVGACLPFLEGNSYGFQVSLTHKLSITRRFGGRFEVSLDPIQREKLRAAHAAAIPRLVAQGFFANGGEWHQTLKDKFFWVERNVLFLWTGLLVQPIEGIGLHLSSCANRRSTLFTIKEDLLSEHKRLTPLLLRLELSKDADNFSLQGELATLGPISTRVTWQYQGLSEAKEIGEAHTNFYDASYFEEKKQKSVRRYRQRVRDEAREASDECLATIVNAGLSEKELAKTLTLEALPGSAQAPAVQYALFHNQLDFSVLYDGLNVSIHYSTEELASQEKTLRALWASVYEASFLQEKKGALWYLTKYFTQHPPGEPHFFVKPWAFFVTPPGWSCVLEGIHGEGYDVLRGVVSTDWFYAAPAVFLLRALNTRVSIPKGTPLLRLFALPRWLLSAEFLQTGFLD